ncbi:response regulator [Salinadaptatus halalkaliphilus]|uniref:protein-glutamate methylesterase n=1 Tax=Salinadaptatus halalkaliphilus TaxID=2419781 RepID=A0A4S3THZ9_9EURY|nr:chemotaxis protein CheB [Salinadaptatus halalkaliphilus]THE62843.1 response regulator [Salinadaptatus halalkaliphilus]
MTRVLVVDDSPRLRSVIGNALATGDYDVVTTRLDDDPHTHLESTGPDVVTIAVTDQLADGLEIAQRLLATSPTPTLVVGPDETADRARTVDVATHDAVDVLATPSDDETEAFGTELVETVDELAAMDVATLAVAHTAATARSLGTSRAAPQRALADDARGCVTRSSANTTPDRADRSPVEPTPTHATAPEQRSSPVSAPSTTREHSPVDSPTIVVGASTGGPSLIERLFATLPAALEATVLVAQHMPEAFTPRFAARLDAVSEYDVIEPTDGDRLRPETAFVAPGNSHLGIEIDSDGHRRVALLEEDGRRPTPSIDVTMTQVAGAIDGPLCGVVLSGMGRDGVAGIQAIKAAGGYTIAQNEATSSVFGIPAKAIETGCVDDIVPPDALVETIIDAMAGEIDE